MRHPASLIPLAALALSAAAAAQSDPPSDAALPAEFRGEIDYAGTYSGQVVTKAEKMRSPGISEVVRSLVSSKTLPLAGDYAITVRFEGNIVRGSARTRSTAGPDGALLAGDTFLGTRSGAECLVKWSQGPQVAARCTADEFAFAYEDYEDSRGDEITLTVGAAPARLVDFRQRELGRVAERVLRIASFADRVGELRKSYDAAGVLPALKCYRMRQEAGLYDEQAADLAWLAGDPDGIAADVRSADSGEASAVLDALTAEKLDELVAAARDGRAAAEADYDATCPKA
jgi:hypothetical protein